MRPILTRCERSCGFFPRSVWELIHEAHADALYVLTGALTSMASIFAARGSAHQRRRGLRNLVCMRVRCKSGSSLQAVIGALCSAHADERGSARRTVGHLAHEEH